MTRTLHSLSSGGYVEPSALVLRDYLEKWLLDYARTNVTAKTYERYADIVGNHLAPALGHVKLAKLQPIQIQDYYAAALRGGRMNGRGGLSARTVLHHHRVLREDLQQAVRWQLLSRNPADAVVPPRPQRKEMRALDEAETARLLSAAAGNWLYMPILLAVTCGLRRGEVLALKWGDINFERASASICRSLEQTRAGLAFKNRRRRERDGAFLYRGSPSTGSGGIARLRPKSVSARDPPTRIRISYARIHWDSRSDTLSGLFRHIARAAGLTPLRLHDLRHTHATQLLRQGVNPKIVSERLGHSTVSFTLDVYAHVLPDMQDAAARRIDESLSEAIARHSDN